MQLTKENQEKLARLIAQDPDCDEATFNQRLAMWLEAEDALSDETLDKLAHARAQFERGEGKVFDSASDAQAALFPNSVPVNG